MKDIETILKRLEFNDWKKMMLPKDVDKRMDCNKLLQNNFGALSTKQYAQARDCGYSKEELLYKDYIWYGQQKKNFVYDKSAEGGGPMLPKQLQFLLENTTFTKEYLLDRNFFNYARNFIREHAKQIGEEVEYIDCFTKETEHNQKGNSRRRKTGKLVTQQEAIQVAAKPPIKLDRPIVPYIESTPKQFPGEKITQEQPVLDFDKLTNGDW